jgi:serine phosphatase RsbU (regulator of sigma subunit)
MKRSIIIACLVLLPVGANTQVASQRAASLLRELAEKTANHPEDAIQRGHEALHFLAQEPDPEIEALVLYEMAWAYLNLNIPDSAWSYAQRTEDVAAAAGFARGHRRAIRAKGRILRNRGDFTGAVSVLEDGISRIRGDTTATEFGWLLNELGMVYRRQSRYGETLDLHRRALAIHRMNGDRREESTTLGLIGIVYDILGYYDNALKHHQQSLEIRQELGDRRGAAASLHNMGVLNQKIRNFPEALKFYREALSVWEELSLEDEIATSLNGIGGVYDLMGDFQAAAEYYRQVLVIFEKLGNPHGVALALNNISSVEAKIGNESEALQLKRRALGMYEQLGDRHGMASAYIGLAEIYNKSGHTDSAFVLMDEAHSIADELGNWDLREQIYRSLSGFYEREERYAEALDAYRRYMTARDSLYSVQSQSVIADLMTQYRTREQQQEIVLLRQSRRVQQLWIGILLGGVVFSFVIAGMSLNRNRLRHRAHEAMQKMQEAEAEQARLRTEAAESRARYLEAENERKTQELQSARDLQLSMLPASLPDHPLYRFAACMKTATEVGGDYYDYHESPDGALTVAIGDATGHGIQAGTIVTATKGLFNLLACETDLVKIIHKASDALKKMNFQKLFMAFALVRIRGNSVQLIGAGMPPALVYRAASKTVEEYPMSGLPLGGYGDYPYKVRTTHMHNGDVILLASDGFAELRDNKDRMLGFERQRSVLLDTGASEPQEIIDTLIGTANRWCDCKPFTDDMTFVAVKMR